MITAHDIASLVRGLDDEALVALVAPVLRERLARRDATAARASSPTAATAFSAIIAQAIGDPRPITRAMAAHVQRIIDAAATPIATKLLAAPKAPMVPAPEHVLGDLGPLEDGTTIRDLVEQGIDVSITPIDGCTTPGCQLVAEHGGEHDARPERERARALHRALDEGLEGPAIVHRMEASMRAIVDEAREATVIVAKRAEHRDTLRNGERLALGRRENFGTCRDCALGRTVASRLEGAT